MCRKIFFNLCSSIIVFGILLQDFSEAFNLQKISSLLRPHNLPASKGITNGGNYNNNGGNFGGRHFRRSGDEDSNGNGPVPLFALMAFRHKFTENHEPKHLLSSTRGYNSRRGTQMQSYRYRGGQGYRRRQSPPIPPSTAFLLIGTVACYVLQMMNPSITYAGAKFAPAIRNGQYHRLVTPIFLHGSLPHLMTNMFSLYNIGPTIERNFGTSIYLSLYLMSGIAGNLLSCYTSTRSLGVGASGAIFGLTGAMATFLVRNRNILGSQSDRGLNALKQTLLVNGIYGFSNPGIDNFAHIGGFIGGAWLSYMLGPTYEYVYTSPGQQALKNTNLLHVIFRHPIWTLKKFLSVTQMYLSNKLR
mmetsp:Transcript_41100/g.54103  ORF Transcript_41100/g.54103 Transcript_41100/m.54103 type:complete len:359 (+) Transcript_41100:53-1129(+)